MYYTETCQPRLSDYDANGKLTPEAVLQILENCGNHHSNLAQDKATEGNIAWILAEWQLRIIRRPMLDEKLKLKTWVHGRAPASIMYRDFVGMDENGEEILRAAAKFVLVDMQTNRLTRITQERFASYGPEDDTAFHEAAPKLREPENCDISREFSLRRSDIDFNHHVHNTRYLGFAVEEMPEELYNSEDFSEIRIVYRSPLKLTDQPVISTSTREGEYLCRVDADEKLCAIISMKKRNRDTT